MSAAHARRQYSPTTAPAFGFPLDAPGGIDRFLIAAPDMRVSPQRPDITDAKGLRSANGYDPLAPRDYLRAVGMRYDGDVLTTRRLSSASSRVLDLLRVTTVLTDAGAPAPAPALDRVGPVAGGRLVRYEHRPALADVFLVGEVRRTTTPAVLAALDGRTPFDPGTTAFVERDCPACRDATQPGPAGTVERRRWDTASVTVDVRADRPALVVVSQAWFPGWRAAVDGRAAPVIRVDGLVQGVLVPAGRHHVRLHYEAPGLRAGALVSGATLAALLVALGVERRFSRSARRARRTPPGERGAPSHGGGRATGATPQS